jgi:hypothetical protein
MLLKNLTKTEIKNLENINKIRVIENKTPIKFDKMPKQEVLTHLYGWDNPNIDINDLLTPKEKEILKADGYVIDNSLKNDINLLKRIRAKRKNPNKTYRKI